MRAGAWEPGVCICLGGRGRHHWRCSSSLPVLSVLVGICRHHWVGLIDICANCLPVGGINPAGLGQLDECSRQGTPERRWHFLRQWEKFKDLAASEEKGCTGGEGSATGGLASRKVRKRDLNACKPCPGSGHHQLSPHGPQPELTCPKDVATVLLIIHEQPRAAVSAKRKCLKRVGAEPIHYIPRSSSGWLLSWSMLIGKAQLSKYLEEVPHLWPPSKAPCAVGHRSRSEAWPWKSAGTPWAWAGCRPPKGCQPSDDTTLGVLKNPQSELFCTVHALIPSLVFQLFSAEFVFGQKALN